MDNTKRLRSVIQSIAHHSISGLCFLHPHIGEYCKLKSIKRIRLNLKEGIFNPNIISISNEIKLSTEALLNKFIDILSSENINFDVIKSIFLEFEFGKDLYPKYCYCCIETVNDKLFESVIDSKGENGEILRKHS